MRIKVNKNIGPVFSLSAIDPGRWDGTPRVENFFLEWEPTSVSMDRIAVAATILFGEYFGGVLHFDAPINLVTANAIRQYLEPVHCYPSTIDEGPKPILSTNNNLVIKQNISNETSNIFKDRTMILMPSHRFKGVLTWHRGLAVASNTWIFDDAESGSYNGSVAAGVIAAASYDSGCVCLALDDIGCASIDHMWARKIQRLIGSTGLRLSIINEFSQIQQLGCQ